MWENGTIPLQDIDEFRRNFRDVDESKLDPEQTLVLNELITITNIYFNDSNLQVPTIIDEICIPKDFPSQPIHIIDFKTGKQFKQPSYREKIQIFLMMTAVLTNVLDKVDSIKFKPNEWDIAHNMLPFPFFTKRNLKNTLVSGIYFDALSGYSDVFINAFRFSYVNPITQRSIDVSPQQLGISSEEEIKEMLMYLYSINNFYSLHKETLKKVLNRNKSPYTLPVFPSKEFDKDIDCSKLVQARLF